MLSNSDRRWLKLLNDTRAAGAKVPSVIAKAETETKLKLANLDRLLRVPVNELDTAVLGHTIDPADPQHVETINRYTANYVLSVTQREELWRQQIGAELGKVIVANLDLLLDSWRAVFDPAAEAMRASIGRFGGEDPTKLGADNILHRGGDIAAAYVAGIEAAAALTKIAALLDQLRGAYIFEGDRFAMTAAPTLTQVRALAKARVNLNNSPSWWELAAAGVELRIPTPGDYYAYLDDLNTQWAEIAPPGGISVGHI
ncbi:MAG: hypothetical protein QM286_13700 [Acidobacteriota bacterium]|nr:hypothetical protein [Acidobacteriota bacterium]